MKQRLYLGYYVIRMCRTYTIVWGRVLSSEGRTYSEDKDAKMDVRAYWRDKIRNEVRGQDDCPLRQTR